MTSFRKAVFERLRLRSDADATPPTETRLLEAQREADDLMQTIQLMAGFGPSGLKQVDLVKAAKGILDKRGFPQEYRVPMDQVMAQIHAENAAMVAGTATAAQNGQANTDMPTKAGTAFAQTVAPAMA
jgi:hypothetical protein